MHTHTHARVASCPQAILCDLQAASVVKEMVQSLHTVELKPDNPLHSLRLTNMGIAADTLLSPDSGDAYEVIGTSLVLSSGLHCPNSPFCTAPPYAIMYRQDASTLALLFRFKVCLNLNRAPCSILRNGLMCLEAATRGECRRVRDFPGRTSSR